MSIINNIFRHFNNYPQRALNTQLVTAEQAHKFESIYQVLALEECIFTAEQALEVNNFYPIIAAKQDIASFIGWSNYLSLNCNDYKTRNENQFINLKYISIDTESISKLKNFKQLLAYNDGVSLSEALKFESITQNIALHFYSLPAHESLTLDTWSKLYKFVETQDLKLSSAVEEEFGWLEFTTKITPLMFEWAYRDAIGDI